jgi:hypothetical protein
MNNKSSLLAALLATAASAALAQTPVSGTLSINKPGVYGRIDIGQYPQPQLVYAQPVLVAPPPVVVSAQPVIVQRQPIYLYVPPGHAKDWKHHCSHYNACSQPVYFVQERWVRERYEEEHHGHGHGHDKDHDKGHDEGHGHGHGHGHDD